MKNLINILLVMLITGCATGGSLRPDMPSASEGRKACNFVMGTVISVQDIIIEADRETSQATGAAVGGYLANQASKDDDDVEQAMKTLAGAVIGNAIGDAVSKGKDRPGLQIFVELGGTGGGITVVQEKAGYNFSSGQEVLVTGYPVERYNRTCSLRVLPKE